jgi:hypothetical protein
MGDAQYPEGGLDAQRLAHGPRRPLTSARLDPSLRPGQSISVGSARDAGQRRWQGRLLR